MKTEQSSAFKKEKVDDSVFFCPKKLNFSHTIRKKEKSHGFFGAKCNESGRWPIF